MEQRKCPIALHEVGNSRVPKDEVQGSTRTLLLDPVSTARLGSRSEVHCPSPHSLDAGFDDTEIVHLMLDRGGFIATGKASLRPVQQTDEGDQGAQMAQATRLPNL